MNAIKSGVVVLVPPAAAGALSLIDGSERIESKVSEEKSISDFLGLDSTISILGDSDVDSAWQRARNKTWSAYDSDLLEMKKNSGGILAGHKEFCKNLLGKKISNTEDSDYRKAKSLCTKKR